MRGVGEVIRELKIQIWDSLWRERSAKRIVQGSEEFDCEEFGGKEAAKIQCLEGRL